jgi:SAM-dependent methyltransferase
MSTRAEREIEASDHSSLYDNQHSMRSRLSHVFQSPNTRYYQQVFDDIVARRLAGKRALEIGCGSGGYARKLHAFGAAYVRAVDISPKRIAEAKRDEIPGVLEYAVEDVSAGWEKANGPYDVIVGRAVLHHLDYQDILPRLYAETLSPGGLMAFWEPLGSSWMIKAYHRLASGLHSEDERPFYRRDLRWLRSAFADFTLIPVNYTSLPLGVISSFVFRRPDNLLLRAADRLDRALASAAPFLAPDYRNGIFVISKPA